MSKSKGEDDLNRRIAAAGLGGNALPEGTSLSKLIEKAARIDGVHNLQHSQQDSETTTSKKNHDHTPRFI